MNTRLLPPVVAFVVWSIICWRWYVCGIKQRCDDNPTPPAAGRAIPFPVDTLLQDASFVYTTPAVSPLPQPPAALPESETGRTDRVSFSERPNEILIHFPYNSIRQQDNAAIEDYLTRLAQYLKESRRTVVLTGHTDNVGDPKTNYRLGLQRAKAIRETLIKKGVLAEQIRCQSKGEKEPIATNDHPRGRYQNRRVEIRIQP